MKRLKILFWVTIFLNSFLLFFIEPIFNRMLLPVAGGSMSVWNIALMSYQIILLGGYFYTHFLPKLVGSKLYTKIHIGLLLASLVASYVLFKPKEFIINTSSPWIDIIIILLTTIGIPFFVTSTSSTNFQRWYGLTLKERPYFLYSLSNMGNLLALIGYGLVVETLLGLKNQILLWNLLYSVAVFIGVYIGLRVLSINRIYDSSYSTDNLDNQIPEEISHKRKIYWLILSFIPNSLMIATNTVLDNVINVTYIHYFWIIPLVIFLVAYIIAFSNVKLFETIIFEKITLWLLMIIPIILFLPFSNYVYIVLMLTLFMVSLVCNLFLVSDAPDVGNLTSFYLFISLGGALGGIFSSIISPLMFNNVYEYPIIIIGLLIILLIKYKRIELFKIDKWEYSGLFIIGFILVILNGISLKSVYFLLALFVFYALRRLFVFRKIRLISLALILIFSFAMNYILNKNTLYQTRNFYGVKKVIKTEYISKDGQKDILNNLLSGNTLHGSQFKQGSINEFEALTYYDKEGSSVGRFFSNNQDVDRVGIVGLGVGILSALSTDEQEWTYFEIDPQVVEIASDSRYFTMLNEHEHSVVIGDARITLQEEENNYYDVLVLDAYTGDLIPASLLTKEAVELYMSKLKPNGIMLFHISNNQFELKPVLSTVAEELRIDCYVDTNTSKGKLLEINSEWVMMTNNRDLVSDDWELIKKYPEFSLWTDDKYSLNSVMKK